VPCDDVRVLHAMACKRACKRALPHNGQGLGLLGMLHGNHPHRRAQTDTSCVASSCLFSRCCACVRANMHIPTKRTQTRACRSPVVGSLLLAGWVVLLFVLIYSTSERFFCPSIERLSEFMKLSPAVAGATLLAFGNGAPDVLTILAAMKAVRAAA